MNWGLLAGFAAIVALIAASNVWLRRRAEAEIPPPGEPKPRNGESPNDSRELEPDVGQRDE